MSSNDSPTLSQDTAFDLLGNVRIRFVLRRLQDRSDGMELSELAEELAAAENGVPPDELTTRQRKRTYVSLSQTLVPKLAEAGVVEYDPDTRMVYPTQYVDGLGQFFRKGDTGIAWHFVYGAVALAGLFLYGFSLIIEVPTFSSVIIGFVVLASVALVSVVHYLSREKLTPKPKIPVNNE